MNSIGGLMCATYNCAEIILAFDPGQRLWPTGSRENSWRTEADREPEARYSDAPMAQEMSRRAAGGSGVATP